MIKWYLIAGVYKKEALSYWEFVTPFFSLTWLILIQFAISNKGTIKNVLV